MLGLALLENPDNRTHLALYAGLLVASQSGHLRNLLPMRPSVGFHCHQPDLRHVRASAPRVDLSDWKTRMQALPEVWHADDVALFGF